MKKRTLIASLALCLSIFGRSTFGMSCAGAGNPVPSQKYWITNLGGYGYVVPLKQAVDILQTLPGVRIDAVDLTQGLLVVTADGTAKADIEAQLPGVNLLTTYSESSRGAQTYWDWDERSQHLLNNEWTNAQENQMHFDLQIAQIHSIGRSSHREKFSIEAENQQTLVEVNIFFSDPITYQKTWRSIKAGNPGNGVRVVDDLAVDGEQTVLTISGLGKSVQAVLDILRQDRKVQYIEFANTDISPFLERFGPVLREYILNKKIPDRFKARISYWGRFGEIAFLAGQVRAIARIPKDIQLKPVSHPPRGQNGRINFEVRLKKENLQDFTQYSGMKQIEMIKSK